MIRKLEIKLTIGNESYGFTVIPVGEDSKGIFSGYGDMPPATLAAWATILAEIAKNGKEENVQHH